MTNIYIRTNGRGNAWPVFLGQEHPFYDRHNYEDLANASYSVVFSDGEYKDVDSINQEVLVDAGHGSVQYLLKNSNRIPETTLLTHPHIDHTLGLDWVAQSFYRLHNKKRRYPVYATRLCMDMTLRMFPHLEEVIDFREISYGIRSAVKEVPGLSVTPYPVFHGFVAVGAAMLLFEYNEGSHNTRKFGFTGDVMSPLFRDIDLDHLAGIQALYVDCNNRFPYPKSNHWSFTKNNPGDQGISDILESWEKSIVPEELIKPHLKPGENIEENNYLLNFLKDCNSAGQLCLCILDLAERIAPQNIMLAHYSGTEDRKYYKEKIMNDTELLQWVNSQSCIPGINTKFHVPRAGNIFKII